MSSKEPKAVFFQMAKEIIRDVIGTGVDSLVPERQQVGSLIHYLCPAQKSGAVSAAHTQEVIYNGEIMRLLRGTGDSKSIR